jgi:UV DNA damage endonuclease
MIGPENLGYACMNHEMSSRPKKHRITTNRTMIKETFNKKGINYAADLAYQNVQDLYKILLWNEENNFKFFRLSSNIFPWHSEYRWEDLPLLEHIERWLTTCGDFAKEHGHRLTSHPGPFNKLTSDNDRIINNTIRDLEAHGWMFDRLGLPRTPFAKINIHVKRKPATTSVVTLKSFPIPSRPA